MSKRRMSNDEGLTRSAGQLLVVSAPSGSGKTTLTQAVMARLPAVTRTVTYTTRPPRPGEVDGQDYHFVSPTEFEQRRRRGELLEWALVHGALYGTSRQDIAAVRCQGLDVFLVIDVQGAASLRQQGVAATYIFILPPSLQELERRLYQRHAEDTATLQRRLSAARQEIAHYCRYDYVIVNDDLEAAITRLQAIVQAERCRVGRLQRDLPILTQVGG